MGRFSWTDIFKKSDPPKPTAREAYELYIQEHGYKADLQAVQLLLKALKNSMPMSDSNSLRLHRYIVSRYQTVDDLVGAFRDANAMMLRGEPISYGPIKPKSERFLLDDFFVSNQGFVLNKEQIRDLADMCVNFYAQQLEHYGAAKRSDRVSYYERVYGFLLDEIYTALRELLYLCH